MDNTTSLSRLMFCKNSEVPYYISVGLFIVISTSIGNGLQIHIIRKTDALHTFTNYLLGYKSFLDILQAVLLCYLSGDFFESFSVKPTFRLTLPILLTLYFALIFGSSMVTSCIAMDRFQAIIYPLSDTRRFRSMKVILPTTGAISLVLGGLSVLLHHPEDAYFYKMLMIINDCLIAILVFLPMGISGILYAIICMKIFSRKMPGNSNEQNEQRRNRMTRRVVLSLMVMSASVYATLIFFILLELQEMVSCKTLEKHLVAKVDGIIMPWIYFLLIEKYRNGLRKIFKGRRSVAQIESKYSAGETNEGYDETKF